MTFQVGFYNLNHERGWSLKIVLNKAIAWFCADFKAKFNGKWREVPSHCELIYNGKMFSADCFSNRVRVKDFKPKKATQWELVDLGEIDKSGEGIATIDVLCGARYDYFALLFFVTGINFQSKKRWFCSEVVVAVLQSMGLFGDLTPHKVSPAKFYKILKGVSNGK